MAARLLMSWSRLSKTSGRRWQSRAIAMAAHIDQLSKIVRFRNRIIHGYDTVDDATVWGIADQYLPRLLAEVELFLREPQGESGRSA
ncbi:MAG: DUF86 domain-containing protein [Phycisphaerae bacterium]|nr:DUF86 domain-containing protein [Phycisphaerae bacterium]